MEDEFENKIAKAMKKFEGKSVKIMISGIIESEFYMNNTKYEIEEGILSIEDCDDVYLEVDIDDIENTYLEFTSNGYALFVLRVGRDLEIEIQTKDDNVVPIRDKIWKFLEESGIAEELQKEACGA